MHRARVRTLAIASAVFATAMGLGACGETPPPAAHTVHGAAGPPRPDTRADAAPLLSNVLDRIDQTGSARSNVQGKLGLIGNLNGDGTVNYQGEQANIALGGQTRMRTGNSTQPVQVALVDDVGYLKSPLLRPAPDKPWVQVTPTGQDFASKLFSPALDQIREATDPRTAFAGVEQATKIQSSAPEQINGVHTTRYDLQVVTDRAAERAQDPKKRDRLQQATKSGVPEQGYQLWVDDSGLPVRFAATKDVAQAGQVSLTSTYRDWGVHTNIQAPPAERVGVFDNPAQAQPPQ